MAQQATSGQVIPSLTEASVGIVARDVLAESHDCHMDQSDGSDNDSSAKSPEVLVCAAADSTTPEEGPGLWIEDRRPTEVEGIEEHEEKEEEEEGGRQEERGKRHKGGKVRGRVPYCFRSPCEGCQTVSTSDSVKGCSPPQCGGECADSVGLPTKWAKRPRG